VCQFELLDPEGKGITIYRNAGNNLPVEKLFNVPQQLNAEAYP
jgi:hypothetical protein